MQERRIIDQQTAETIKRAKALNLSNSEQLKMAEVCIDLGIPTALDIDRLPVLGFFTENELEILVGDAQKERGRRDADSRRQIGFQGGNGLVPRATVEIPYAAERVE